MLRRFGRGRGRAARTAATSLAARPRVVVSAMGSHMMSTRLTAAQRLLVERTARGHVGVVGGFATGKSTAAAERVLWLDTQNRGDRRVLALSGQSTDRAALVRNLDRAVSFHALERRGHRVASVMEWTQHTLEELGFSPDGKRVLSFGQLTAFLMHHAHKLPLRVFHERLATASSMQLRRSVADMLRFFTTLEAHGVTSEAYAAYAADRAAATGDEDHMELAHAFRVYRELQQRHDVRSWDGLVLDLAQLFQRDPHCLSAATSEFTDVVVDDLDRMSPAMVHLLGLIVAQPHVQSSLSFSYHKADDLQSNAHQQKCPRTVQLHSLLEIQHPETVLLPNRGDEASRPSRDRERVRHLASRVLTAPFTGLESRDTGVRVTSLAFDSFEDEANAVATLLKEKLATRELPHRVTVLCPSAADVAYVSQVLLSSGVRVNGRAALDPSRRHLFDEPGVDTLFSLLVVLWTPSDTKHLYNVLRSEFFAFPADVLSRIMEKQHRRASHASLTDVLTAFVDSQGSDLRPAVNDDALATSLAAAARFLATVNECRDQCHAKTVSDIVQLFLERAGHLERLLDPQTPHDARQAIALAAFLREIDAAQRIVQSAHVPFVMPYLVQLQSARVVTIGDDSSDSKNASEGAQHGDDDVGVRVIPLIRFELDEWTATRGEDTAHDLVVLMAMRDAKFPGRLKRITWPLPKELLSSPLPIQTRAEFVADAERLVYDALTQLNPAELVISYAKRASAGATKKQEKLSRVLEPLWTTPSPGSPAEPSSSSPNIESSTPLLPSPSSSGIPAAPAASISVSGAAAFEPPHLSYSQISEYMRCPHKYYLSRVLGLRDLSSSDDAPHLGMMFGSAVHEAVAAFATAIQRGDSTAHAEQAAFSVLEDSWRHDGFLSKRQEAFFKERAVSTLRGFLRRHSSASEIVAVEKEFECRLGRKGDVPLRGVWDRVDRTPDGHVVIREFKTNPSAQRRANLDGVAAESLQLKIYLVAYEQLHGEAPFGASLEVLEEEQDATRRSASMGFVEYSREMRAEVDEAVDATMDAIRRGEFPAKPGFMECAMCPYASSACRANAAADENQATASIT